MKNCPNCNTPFEPNTKRQKFCSDNCRKLSHAKKVTVISHTVTQPKAKLTHDDLQLMYPDMPAHLLSRRNNLETLKRCLVSFRQPDFPITKGAIRGIEQMIELKEQILNLELSIHKMREFRKGTSMGEFIRKYGTEHTRAVEELDDLIIEEAVRISKMKRAS